MGLLDLSNLNLKIQIQSILKSVSIHCRLIKTLKGFFWHSAKTNTQATL